MATRKANSNLISLQDDGDFRAFIRKIQETKNLTGEALDMIVAEVAAKGRRAESKAEDAVLNLGYESYQMTFDWKGKRWNPATYGGSVWNQKLGGYVPARSGHISRLINFSYETKASLKRGGNGRFSKVGVSSQIFNLFSHDTKPYKANSPWFMNTANNGKWRSIRKGNVRKGKLALSSFRQNVEGAMPTALRAGEKKYQEMLDDLERKQRR